MIINSSSAVSASNIVRSCWAGIKKFHNTSYVTNKICDIHHITEKQKTNVSKQAEQIRYCLVQAKEYYDAAQSISLATKPVLLYYSIMSLALAEILLKQDGESSLDRARGNNAHHGLTFHNKITKNTGTYQDLSISAENLYAKPMVISNKRYGTFELWHSSSREYPVVGEKKIITNNYSTLTSFDCILSANDSKIIKLPESGITLLECLKSIPTLNRYVESNNIISSTIRGSIKQTVFESEGYYTIQIVIHPGSENVLNEFYSNISCSSNMVDSIEINELTSGIILKIKLNMDERMYFNMPMSSTIDKENIIFNSKNISLNEFGLFYVALYMCGNYARYFPDQWLSDVERSTPLSLAIEELIHQAEERVPLLSLSELSRSYFVPQ